MAYYVTKWKVRILRLNCSFIFPISQVALAWGIKRGTPVLPKAVSENHIKENLKALHVELDEDDMKAIENIGIHHRYITQKWMYKPDEIPEKHWDDEDWTSTERMLVQYVD